MQFTIREGTLEDSIGIATVHLRTWQMSYRSFFPLEHLDNYSISESAQNWKTRIESLDKKQEKLFIAEDNQNQIIGFASGGPAGLYEKSSIQKCDCEVYAIYVVNEQQNMGIGNSLIN